MSLDHVQHCSLMSGPSFNAIPQEPSADLRTLASTLRQMYVALVAEGFTEKQALNMTSQVIEAGMNATRPNPE